jgi:hypothetical protein
MITTVRPAEESLTLGHDLDEQLRHAEREYRLELGWPAVVHGDQLLLELDDDTWGLLVPRSLAVALVAELGAVRLSCPVVVTAIQQCVLLLEPTEAEAATLRFPVAVRRLPTGAMVSLPPSTTAHWLEPAGADRAPVGVVADLLVRLAQRYSNGPQE